MQSDPPRRSQHVTPRITTPPTYWHCEPQWHCLAPVLGDYLLWYVLDGVGWLELDQQRLDLTPGRAVVFVPGDQPHAGYDPSRRLLIYGMHFDHPSPYVPSAPPRLHTVRDQNFFRVLAARCDSGYQRSDALGTHGSHLCLEQMLCLLHEESLSPPPTETDELLNKIVSSIRQDPGHP